MVFYYKTRDESYHVYVGKDKHENELLIKHGWENDVWFHVDKVSHINHIHQSVPSHTPPVFSLTHTTPQSRHLHRSYRPHMSTYA